MLSQPRVIPFFSSCSTADFVYTCNNSIKLTIWCVSWILNLASCLVFLVRVCSFSEYPRVKTFSVGKDAKCRVKICPAQADFSFVSYQVIFQIFT